MSNSNGPKPNVLNPQLLIADFADLADFVDYITLEFSCYCPLHPDSYRDASCPFAFVALHNLEPIRIWIIIFVN